MVAKNDHTLEEMFSVIILKTAGLLSMIGSFLIMRDVRHRHLESKNAATQINGRNNHQHQHNHRGGGISLTTLLVFELSVADFFSSLLGPVMGTWMAPVESGAYLAAGSDGSCTVQGFLKATFYAASALCSASLAVAYCLIVKRGWRDSNDRRLCSWILCCLPLLGLSASVGPLIDGAYSFGVTSCGIGSYPPGCNLADSAVSCTRGSHAFGFLLYALGILLGTSVVVIVSVLTLVHSVYVLEKKMDRYAGGCPHRTNTIKTTWQGVWYIAAFALAWWPFASFYLVKALGNYPPQALRYAMVMTCPAQGAYNAIVYFRPKYKSDRESHSRDSKWASTCRILRFSFEIPPIPTPWAADRDQNCLSEHAPGHDTKNDHSSSTGDATFVSRITSDPMEGAIVVAV